MVWFCKELNMFMFYNIFVAVALLCKVVFCGLPYNDQYFKIVNNSVDHRYAILLVNKSDVNKQYQNVVHSKTRTDNVDVIRGSIGEKKMDNSVYEEGGVGNINVYKSSMLDLKSEDHNQGNIHQKREIIHHKMSGFFPQPEDDVNHHNNITTYRSSTLDMRGGDNKQEHFHNKYGFFLPQLDNKSDHNNTTTYRNNSQSLKGSDKQQGILHLNRNDLHHKHDDFLLQSEDKGDGNNLTAYKSSILDLRGSDNHRGYLHHHNNHDGFSLQPHDDDHNWHSFKSQFNKSYASLLHEKKAREAWTENQRHVEHHNHASNHSGSYKLANNPLSDLTLRQYLRKVVKLVPANTTRHPGTPLLLQPQPLPETVDWRVLGYSPVVSSQKHCGACYAFSVAHAMEAQLWRASGRLKQLSPQQLVDCGGSFGTYGCGGGSLNAALRYLQAQGAMASRDYPYEARVGRCRWSKARVVAHVDKWGMLPSGDEEALQRAVALVGPVPVSIDASRRSFQFYHSGIYDEPSCSTSRVNHAVLVVGYGPGYWLILNWWGEHWGQQGYMKMRRGKNSCAISSFAAYVTVNN